jgi:hypothetical protein
LLLAPRAGEGAKKTNKDYTGGKLGELLDIVIEERVALFVCAVGVPPKWACDKLHQHGSPETLGRLVREPKLSLAGS